MSRRGVTNQNELTKRNRDIYDKHQDGVMLIELSKEYGLSVPRVHRIVVQEEVKDLREKNVLLENQVNSCNNILKYKK